MPEHGSRRLSASLAARTLSTLALAGTGVLALWSRSVGLGQSLWVDETYSVLAYSSRGPSAILTGEYRINNHVLYNLLAWAASSLAGRTETVLRLCSVIPDLAAVALVTAWLWRRFGRVPASLFAFLAVVEPRHLDLVRLARGYGLITLAFAGTLVAGDAVIRRGARRDYWLFAASGLAGILTFPLMAPAFLTAAAVLFADRRRRKTIVVLTTAVGAISLVVVGRALPTLLGVADDFRHHRRLSPIGPLAPLTWPANHLAPLLAAPARALTDSLPSSARDLGTWLAFVLGYPLIALALHRLLRRGEATLAALLVLPPAVVFTGAAVASMALAPRYTEYALVPTLVLIAIGAGAVIELAAQSRVGRACAVTLACGLAVPLLASATGVTSAVAVSLGFAFAGGAVALLGGSRVRWLPPAIAVLGVAAGATGMAAGLIGTATFIAETPREDFKHAAEVLRDSGSEIVIATRDGFGVEYYVKPDAVLYRPDGLDLELSRPSPPVLSPQDLARLLCRSGRSLALVSYGPHGGGVDTRCLRRRGALRRRFAQRSTGAGRFIEVWTLPSGTAPVAAR